ncbi:MAG: DUF1573 domain-containing protein [Isosphaeraceae bacterium]|nr:DUF1573 domain-containing protein [Isosphaeraceae bacterium]
MRLIALALLTLLGPLTPPPADAQGWLDTVFPERRRDAGTVARGSKIRHAFKVVNTTDQEIHIATWRTKCGCTEVRVGSQTIPPGTQTVVEAVLDTTKFQGYKASGLTLVIDRPSFVEVDLDLNCFIRGDLTLEPGFVDFGQANRAGKPQVQLSLLYAGGQQNWAIERMQTQTDHVTAKLTEQSRGGGQVRYLLTATLNSTAPVGRLKEEITLHTNDPTGPTIPVSVTGLVQSNVTVSPTVINLGQIKAGETVRKTILVRSTKPFKLTGLQPSSPDLEVPAAAAADAPKALHTVNFSFKAPARPGPFHGEIEVMTDVPDEPPAKLTAFATIVP